jgi:hypothetical protein
MATSSYPSVTEFGSVKMRKGFLQWLKIEAAKQGVPMYELIENLAAKTWDGRGRPWSQNRG